jgi:VIT1/CCC1 family predicted Fe2+/Mn2+ transporter
MLSCGLVTKPVSTSTEGILIAGVAALTAGAMSMAAGEYVSVSSQSDTERADLDRERLELAHDAVHELTELTGIYITRGLDPVLAAEVARHLTAHDALGAHLEAELHITEHQLTNPWHAALSSAIAFIVGAALPLITVLLSPVDWRIGATFISVIVALALTGGLGAFIGGSQMPRAILRVTIGGAAALAVTFGIGTLIGGGNF